MKITYDFHIHSCLSPCGDDEMTPNNIIGMAEVLELSAIAVSDHNSALNLPAICKVGKEHDILVVPAIEITTAEEVHVLSLFPDVDTAVAMGEYLYQFLPEIMNDSAIFGNQLIMDHHDNVVGKVDKLLINATSLSIEQVFQKVRELNGIPIPAHVDKNSYSIFSNLGFIPPELDVSTVEVKNPPFNPVSDYFVISNSDAHTLEVMGLHDVSEICVAENTIAEILKKLQK